jgi:hypothetical protein
MKMSEFKHEEVGDVEVIEDFEAYKYDDDGDLIETVTVKQGTKGEIVSMGWSSSDGFRHCYDVVFQIDGEDQEISMYEDKLERHLNLSLPQDIETTESPSASGGRIESTSAPKEGE